jgi:hypothetical protein
MSAGMHLDFYTVLLKYGFLQDCREEFDIPILLTISFLCRDGDAFHTIAKGVRYDDINGWIDWFLETSEMGQKALKKACCVKGKTFAQISADERFLEVLRDYGYEYQLDHAVASCAERSDAGVCKFTAGCCSSGSDLVKPSARNPLTEAVREAFSERNTERLKELSSYKTFSRQLASIARSNPTVIAAAMAHRDVDFLSLLEAHNAIYMDRPLLYAVLDTYSVHALSAFLGSLESVEAVGPSVYSWVERKELAIRAHLEDEKYLNFYTELHERGLFNRVGDDKVTRDGAGGFVLTKLTLQDFGLDAILEIPRPMIDGAAAAEAEAPAAVLGARAANRDGLTTPVQPVKPTKPSSRKRSHPDDENTPDRGDGAAEADAADDEAAADAAVVRKIGQKIVFG